MKLKAKEHFFFSLIGDRVNEFWYVHRANIIWLLKIVQLLSIKRNAKIWGELVIDEHVQHDPVSTPQNMKVVQVMIKDAKAWEVLHEGTFFCLSVSA